MKTFSLRRLPRALATAGTVAVTFGLAACGTLKERAEAVQITATASEVSACEKTGPVLLGTFDSEFDQRQRDLRFETARKGGNVLLVDSYATATTGTAYFCQKPIDPRRAAS
jgi:hypothetical protein